MKEENLRQIDRLVDGELNEHERRELIQSFDHDPDGWRRCACAFLESQEFGRAVGLDNVAFQAAADPRFSADDRVQAALHVETSKPTAADDQPDDRGNLRWWMAIAACLTLGITVGHRIRPDVDSADPTASPSAIARESTSASQNIEANANVTDSVGISGQSFLASSDAWQTDLMDVVLEPQYSVIPNDIEEILLRLGQRVERRRLFVPASASDGPARLPVEEVEILTVDADTY